MNLTQRVASNSLWQLLAQVIGLVTSLASVMILSRHLGGRGFGEYSTAVSVALLLGSLSDLGLSTLVTREVAQQGEGAVGLVHTALGLRLASSILVVSFAVLGTPYLPYTRIVRQAIVIMSLAIGFLSLSSILAAVAQAHLRMKYVALGDILNRLVALGAMVWAAQTGRSLLWILGGIALAHAVQFGMLVSLSRRLIRIRIRVALGAWWNLLRQSTSLAFMAILAVAYARADMVVLSLYYDPSIWPDAGMYGAAYRVLDALLIVPVALVGSIFPLLARSRSEPNSPSRVSHAAFRVIAALAFPMVGGGVLFAGPIMHTLMGSGVLTSEPSALALRILLIALFFMFFGYLNGQTLVAMGQQATLLRIFIGVVLLNITLCLALIPRYSFVGAALATVASEAVGLVATTKAVASVGIHYPWSWIRYPSIAALGMIGLLWVMNAAYRVHVIILTGMGAIVYSGMLYASGGFPADLLKAFLARRKA